MATKLESEYPPSPTNDESGGEERDVEPEQEEEEEDEEEVNSKPPDSNSIVAGLLKRLESSGALLKKPKQEYRCFTCEESFPDWEELENHLIQHVSLPSVVIDKLPSDDEYLSHSGDENWSDEEDTPVPQKQGTGTPQKIDISQILKKTGISIKKTETDDKSKNPSAALDKLSGLGFTIKKNNTPIKQEKVEPESSNNVLQKLGKLGGIKLKLKSDGNNTNSFKVVNGLKDFKTSDDEGEESSNEANKEDSEDEGDREQEFSGGEPDSDDQLEADGPSKPATKIETTQIKNVLVTKSPQKPGPKSILEKELTTTPKPVFSGNQSIVKEEQIKPTRPPGRPSVKQTPKRGPNNPVISKEHKSSESPSPLSEPARTPPVDTRDSQDANMENVVVKKEFDSDTNASSTGPLFSGQIKTERPSSPFAEQRATTPILATIKSEPPSNTYPTEPIQPPKSIPPVTKTESSDITVIEINGDSNDEDDDCCVVSTTPAPDIKPIIPKVENTPVVYPPPVHPTPQSSYSSTPSATSRLPGTPSLEKQHTFNWNAPDSKPPLEMLEKSADDIFESLLSASTKKESISSLSEPSEYISLDTLGPQHTCDVCNTRFTDMSLLHDHIRMTGHSKSIITASPSTNLMPYTPQSNILSSLLPVKQLAEQVGKLSGMGGSGPGFTHQQNVMINIQAYPGAGGMGGPGQAPYNPYNQSQNMHGGYGQTPNNMYSQGQTMPGQYPGQSYMGSSTAPGYDQYQSPMSKTSYSGAMPQNSFSPYSTASPMQNMQPSVYGQAPGPQQMGMMGNQQMGQMGPPGSPYVPTSSPGGSMKPNSGVRIQNVQTFQLGQMMGAQGSQSMTGQPGMAGPDMIGAQVTNPGQAQGMQMPPPNQIRMAVGANLGSRPRAPGVRGPRPSVRPGVQVHGQVRGARLGGPRMPMKRPAGIVGGPAQKRRNDMLLPGKHDNEDCQVMSMQKQREGLPLIQSVQGAKDKLNLGSQISITKKTVNKEANAMANVLASRGISVKQKQKSRSPSPERPVPRIPNLGAGVSIKHTSKSSSFNIPEAKVGGGMLACRICKKMFMNSNSLTVHMANAHPQHKVPAYKCDECPASYPTSLQLQHHKRVFHNVNGPNRELGLPVVDLSQEDNLKRLSNLGIYSFIPLANRELANGCFGIPVISVHNVQNGLTTSMQALGADGLLSLGPMKPLPNS